MRFVTDPLTLALALGLLGPAAVDEVGDLDEGTPGEDRVRDDLVRALADELDAEIDDAGQSVVLTEDHYFEE